MPVAGRRLTLQRYELQNVNYFSLGAFRLRVEASDPHDTGADPNIFVYLRGPYSPTISGHVDTFHAVASPVDMEEYPIGEPTTETEYPFFRSSVFEIDFRAVGLAEEAWSIILSEADLLLKKLDRLEDLRPTITAEIGATDETGGSSSSGSSDSLSGG